ncbi:carbonic anhydrase [Limnobacter thiooxidans]|uniref:Carbonic anhydrase 2 n=1 Tax=Limnobacter thiooxidans TaxID=131080 RepID=A0AA86J550_9BURK|nr:carbonate dehydratase [Limnobacter sp.]MCZ8016114.1 carbonate dehydratase [Limnobacter sp.]RZS40051.1 carbonic anhydrase [Limnobacter thiooxidans]BET27519.1 carbonate dehydratase [Limnobacter thiooxidans]
MTTDLSHLLDANRTWASAQIDKDPEFFKRLENQQSPEYFWIGCSDSRVPANTIVNLQPGEVFVHRNVANQVFHGDLNGQSATQFAVEILKVKHIIVCGHYGCSGVRMAMRGDRMGLADAWVRPIHQLARRHNLLSNDSPQEQQYLNQLCELNVIEQVKHLCESTIIEDAWERGQNLTVHGWVYSLKDGLVRNLQISISSRTDMDQIYTNSVSALKKRYS